MDKKVEFSDVTHNGETGHDLVDKYFQNSYKVIYHGMDTIKRPRFSEIKDNDFLRNKPLQFEWRAGKKYILYKWNGAIYFTLNRELDMTVTDKLGADLIDGEEVCFVCPTATLVGNMPELDDDCQTLSRREEVNQI